MKVITFRTIFLLTVTCTSGLASADGLLDRLKKAVPTDIREQIEKLEKSAEATTEENEPNGTGGAQSSGANASTSATAPSAVITQSEPRAEESPTLGNAVMNSGAVSKPQFRDIRGEKHKCDQMLGAGSPEEASREQHEAYHKCMMDMHDRSEAILGLNSKTTTNVPPNTSANSADGGQGTTSGTSRALATPSSAAVVSFLAGSPYFGDGGLADGAGAEAKFAGPTSIAVDGAGNILVVDSVNHRIRKITPAGQTTTLTDPIGSHGGNGRGGGDDVQAWTTQRIFGIAIDSIGNIYVSSPCIIRKISPSGAVTALVGDWRCDGGAIDGQGTAGRIGTPTGLATDNAGNVFLIDSGNSIRRISPSGTISTLAGTPGPGGWGSADGMGMSARFKSLAAIATDSSGNVYTSDLDSKTIRKITPAGLVTTLAGTAGGWGSADGTGATASFKYPSGIVVDSSDNLYVIDAGSLSVRKVTPTGSVTTVVDFAHQPHFGQKIELRGIAIHGHSLYLTVNDGVVVLNNIL